MVQSLIKQKELYEGNKLSAVYKRKYQLFAQDTVPFPVKLRTSPGKITKLKVNSIRKNKKDNVRLT